MPSRTRRVAVSALLLWASLSLTACGGGGGYEGKWDSTFGGISLDIQSGNKVAITSMGQTFEGTWEVTGKNQIVIHGPREDMTLTKTPEGELSAGLGLFRRAKN